jgi:hypothetical protein
MLKNAPGEIEGLLGTEFFLLRGIVPDRLDRFHLQARKLGARFLPGDVHKHHSICGRNETPASMSEPPSAGLIHVTNLLT